MRSTLAIVVVSVVLVFLGAALLKGAAADVESDPTASVSNGAPRGMLAAYLLLSGREVLVRSRDSDPPPPAGALVVVTPPERSAMTTDDAKALLAHVERGGRLLLLCDDEETRNERLEALLDALGAGCVRVDVAIGDETVTRAVGTMPGFSKTLFVRGSGRVTARGKTTWAPAWMSASDVVVQKRLIGQGVVTHVGSATILANDGLPEADNAAFLLEEIPPDVAIVFDERHHRQRSSFALASALQRGTGPMTALIVLMALIPLSLLSLAPRPGDPPRGDESRGAPAAAAQARALAALLRRAK